MPIAARSRTARLVALCFVLCASLCGQIQGDSDLVAHEWGTFTSVAGKDGVAVKWSTLKGSAVLPSFVQRFAGPQAKASLFGTIRMETPVLYFYSQREMSVSVKVKFSKGLITEWYPPASHVEPGPEKILDQDVLYRQHRSGSIAWNSVTVSPAITRSFPRDVSSKQEPESQYYAARETAAAPLVVKQPLGNSRRNFFSIAVFPVLRCRSPQP
jgi:hypothetical protein